MRIATASRNLHTLATVILTGFEPFGGARDNSSWEAVQALKGGWNGDAQLVAARLPVEFSRAGTELVALIDRHAPDLIIATGVARGRTKITPERVALNLADSRAPDNAGHRPVDEAIIPDGPDAYFSRLPVRELVERMTAAGIPAELSLTAGSYVCNDTMYRLLHHVSGTSSIAGFVHVPDASLMPVETICSALQIAIDVGLESLALQHTERTQNHTFSHGSVAEWKI